MKERTKFYMDCHLAGRKYHEADFVWEKLKVGTLLRLERDDENKYDPEAVAVMYDDEENHEVFCIGYVPKVQNSDIAALLDMGWNGIFECRISKINEEAHPEEQINLTIRIKRCKA